MSQSSRKPLKGNEIFLNRPQKQTPEPQQKTSTKVVQKNRSTVEHVEIKPIKAGFYLPEELVDKLDEVWIELRRQVGRKLNKSDIVRVALQEMIGEYEATKGKSKYISKLS